jgi:predicted Zn-dependent protease
MVMYHDPRRQLRESFEAARGLYEAGKFAEALQALEEIPAPYQAGPEMLEFRCHLYLGARQWDLAAELAQRLAEITPAEPGHWISWAFAVRRLHSIEAAEKILQDACARHPQCATIHFNLACYAAQTHRLELAAARLQEAIRLEPALARQAREDPDLLPLFQNPPPGFSVTDLTGGT